MGLAIVYCKLHFFRQHVFRQTTSSSAEAHIVCLEPFAGTRVSNRGEEKKLDWGFLGGQRQDSLSVVSVNAAVSRTVRKLH